MAACPAAGAGSSTDSRVSPVPAGARAAHSTSRATGSTPVGWGRGAMPVVPEGDVPAGSGSGGDRRSASRARSRGAAAGASAGAGSGAGRPIASISARPAASSRVTGTRPR